MANLFKKGFEWFPFDVNFFRNKNIRVIRGRYGGEGVEFLLYLYCLVHDDGFYSIIDDDFYFIAATDLGHSYEKIGQMLNFFLKRSLFDETLFKTDKVLTSRRIQRQFQDLVKSRKQAVEIDEKFWLLSEDETRSCIKVTHKEGKSEKIGINSRKNNQNSKKTATEYSRVKESKGEESKGEEQSSAPLTQKQLNDLSSEFGTDKVNEYINRFNSYCEETGKNYTKPALTIRRWIIEDKKKEKDKSDKSNKFCNYNDTNKIDYSAYEEQIMKEMIGNA